MVIGIQLCVTLVTLILGIFIYISLTSLLFLFISESKKVSVTSDTGLIFARKIRLLA